MSLWLVRAGKYGQDEDFSINEKRSIIGWEDLPDLSGIQTRDELKALHQQHYPDMGKRTIINSAGQLWAFARRMEHGDLVVLPLKTRSTIALGKVGGDYEYFKGRHTRPVKWLNTDIPRDTFGQDLLYSFGAFMTVCQIKRNDAETRIRAVLDGKPDPLVVTAPLGGDDASPDDMEALPDLNEYAADQIRAFIGRKFKGHELSRLVE